MMAECYAELFGWFAAGRLVPIEGETYPLERAVDARRRYASTRAWSRRAHKPGVMKPAPFACHAIQ
jgi:NADPH:quinone reductase-like Zn-dependent oxidoreductase